MFRSLSRRRLLGLAPAAAIGGILTKPASAARSTRAGRQHGGLPEFFPHQDPQLVRAVVGASHSNLERVRELVERHPALARASWDWGFGDWETALGAASHTGRREIAQLLLANGARPTLFSAAMLGQLDVVRATIEASPGIQRTPGPHGIPLLAHARVGGEPAAAVVAYLERVGDADHRPPLFSDEAAAQAYLGNYAFGDLDRDRVTIAFTRERLQLVDADGNARNLHPGPAAHRFFPAGVPDVQITFAVEDARSTGLTIEDGDLRRSATRLAE